MEYLLVFAYNLRKQLPNSQLFYSLYSFAKFIALILISHNVSNLEDNVLSIDDLFICFTVYGKGYKQYVSSYFGILVIFFYFMASFIILTFFTIILIKKNHGCALYDKLSTIELALIKIIARVLTCIAFISQHLIEYLTLGILDVVFPNMKLIRRNSSSIDYIFSTFCITNLVFCEITSITFYYISKSFSSVSPIGDPNIFSFSSSDVLLIVMTSIQGIFGLHNINETSPKFHYYLNIFLAIILLLHCILEFKTFNYYDTNYSLLFEKFLFYFCLISSVDEIVLSHVCKTPFTQSYSFCKLSLEIINAFILTKLAIMYSNSIYINGFTQKVFNEKLKLSPFEVMAYLKEIIKFRNHEKTFTNLFQLFSLHKEHCTVVKCPCHYLSVIKWINQVKGSSLDIDEKEVINRSYEDFLILGEHEINKLIYFYYKSKRNRNILDRLITLHIEYILNVKKQLFNGMYLSSQYLLINNEKMSFKTRLTLYEYKLITFDKLTKEKRKRAKSEFGNYMEIEKDEDKKNFEKMDLFYQYTLNIEKIKQLLIVCCDLLSKIFDFCKAIEIKTTGLQKKCEYFFRICKDYQRNHIELFNTLLKTQNTIKHYEISYLLSMYFYSSIGYIPEDINNSFINIMSYHYFLNKQNDKLDSYEQYNQVNPMMIFINPADAFIIKYISLSLCSKLNYKKQDLMNTEFNQLIPKELIPMHNLVLKKFVLCSRKSHKSNSFIFDKERNMIPVKLEFNTILTLVDNFGIIISVDFSYKESLYERDYFLLLDKDMMMISMNKSFSDNFYFNLETLQLLKMNFCTFFGINQERIAMKVQTLLNSNAKAIGSMEQENKALTVFSQMNTENMFTNMKVSNNLFRITKRLAIHDKISKKGIIKNLDHVNRLIEEFGLDIEWYSRVNCLRERMELMKSSDLEIDYSIVNIEDLIYTIVNIKEKKNKIQYLENNINVISSPSPNSIENIRSVNRYSISKSNRSITNSNDNFDMTSFAKVKMSSINQQTIGFKPRPELKKEHTISGFSVNSMFSLNRSRIVLLNLPDNGNNKNHHKNKDFLISLIKYETRELFAFKTVQKYLHWSYKLLGICIIFLSFLPFILNSSFIKQSKNLNDIAIFSLMLKSNIYFSSLAILTCCDNAEANDHQSLKEQKVKLVLLANEMLDHFSIFSKTVNKLVKYPIKSIFDLLKSEDEYSKIMKNFEITTKSSEIYDELFFIHYYLIQLSEDSLFESCRLKQVFINKNYLKLIDTVPGPNYEETIIYYIINNTLFSLKKKIEALTHATYNIIQLHFKKGKSSILLYNSILILFEVLLGVSFASIIQYNKTNMQILLNMIYTKFAKEDKCEIEIRAFKLILEDFSIETCLKYEDIKKTQPKCESVSEYIEEKKHKKMGKSRMNNLKKPTSLNNIGHNIKRYSNELTTPKLIKFSVGISTFLIATFCIIIAVNVLLSKMLYDNLMFAIVISINFINRIPKICELYMYVKLSIILNDVNFITTSSSNYNNDSYFNYYNISLDTQSNTMFTILKDSQFSYLYYQLMQIQGNIEQFISKSKSTSVLNQLTQWEKLFNSKQGLCIYAAVGQYSISGDSSNSISAIESISKNVTKCRTISNGMTINTLNAYISISTQELKNIYIDFATFNPLTRDPLNYLSNNIFTTIGFITTGPLKHIHDILMYYITSDLNKICSQNNLINLIVSLVLVFLSLGVFIYVHFFLIHQIERNIDTLIFIQDINAKAE